MSAVAEAGSFVQAMNAPGLRKTGVKGSDVYTEEGVGDGRVALFQQLVRGCERTYINKAIQAAFSTTGVTDEVLRDYAVMTFQTRDIRGGKGERDLFYVLLLALFQARPSLIKPLVELIPEYGCWQDVWKLWFGVDTDVEHKVSIQTAIKDLVVRTWFKDVATAEGKPVSLLGKWLPREKSKYHMLAVEFANIMFPEIEDENDKLRAYRKSCAELNARLKTTEVSMCSGTWATIEPGKVPGRLLNKCRTAFLNEILAHKGRARRGIALRFPYSQDRMACREHFKEHMAAALRGETSVKGADVVYPHEIVAKHFRGLVGSEDEEALLQAQWNAIRDATAAAGGLKGAVPLCDFSGSMSGIPMEVSMALGILLSEINHPAFKDGMIGFDSTPSWISFKPEMSLKEKVHHARRFAKGLSTNFQAACQLILTRLVDYKVPIEEAPKDMIVFTDMGFDQACGGKTAAWETHIEMIRNSFMHAGYVAPRIVLWNLRAEYKDFHAKANEDGVVLLSGWSPAILKAIQKAGVEIRTPYEGMRELLDDARYDAVRAVWAAATA